MVARHTRFPLRRLRRHQARPFTRRVLCFLGSVFLSERLNDTRERFARCESVCQNFVAFKSGRSSSCGVAARCRSSRRRKCLAALLLQHARPHLVVVRPDLAATLCLRSHVAGLDDKGGFRRGRGAARLRRRRPERNKRGAGNCKSPIETSLASSIEVSRSSICERPIEVAWNDGDHDEPQ